MGSIIKRERVHLTEGETPPVSNTSSPSASAGHGPQGCAPSGAGASARLVRAGGRVRAIELTCACGTTTVLEVDYDVVPDDAPKEMS